MSIKKNYTVSILKNMKSEDVNVFAWSRSSIYHLTEWLELINKVFRHNAYCLVAKDKESNIVGILPLVHMTSLLFGNYITSMPYFNYGGVISDDSDAYDLLVDEAIKLAKSLGASHIEFRDVEKRNINWPVRTEKVNMILRLPETEEELGKSIGSKKRSQVRRATKEGVVTEIGGINLLDDFYLIFSENMRDLGTPVYGKDFFSEILLRFPQSAKIIVLKKDGLPISAAFLIGFKDLLQIPWASTLRKYNYFSPNMFLYWQVLCYAIDEGFKYFDFGRSTVDSGTYRFKKQWGAKPKQLYWYYWLSEDAEEPKLNPENPKYKLAINMWKRLPLFVANYLGPKVVKNLP